MSASDHMNRVGGLPCIICWKRLAKKTYGVQVHHVGETCHRNDYAVVSLCPEHHVGATGVHGMHRRPFERFWKADDVLLLAWTNEALHKFA